MVTNTEKSTPYSFTQALQQLPHQNLTMIVKPGTQTMTEETGKATWKMIVAQLVVYGIACILRALLNDTLMIGLPIGVPFMSIAWIIAIVKLLLYGGVISIIALIYPLLFALIATVLLQGLARLFGGQGSFLKFLYTSLLFLLPLLLVQSILQDGVQFIFRDVALSWLGDLSRIIVNYGIMIYIGVLQAFALMAVHRLSQGKALACVFILIGISIPLVMLTGIFFF